MIYNAFDETGKVYPFHAEQHGESLLLTLKKEDIQNTKKLWILKELSLAHAGDEGYYILPRSIDLNGDMQIFFRPRENTVHSYRAPIMACFGIKKKDLCCLIRIERNHNFGFQVQVVDGEYSLTPCFEFVPTEENVIAEKAHNDIRVEIVHLPLTADYNDMAAMERRLRLDRGEIVTVAQRCRREAVEYARKYPLIRIRMGWKQSPNPITHQSPENPPEMYVACTFPRVRHIADELKRQGVEGAELQLVGWNIDGHDGRYPQMFPVDPRLGGEKEFRKTIGYVKSLGYRISVHTNSLDAYTIADSFSWDDIVVLPDGRYHQTGHYSAGYAYHVCPQKQIERARNELPKVAALGLNGLHYTDVSSIVVPDPCQSKAHPMTTSQSLACVLEEMELTAELFGGYSSEGCMDFSLKYLDFGLYVSFGNGFGDNTPAICDRLIPFWQITYHGISLYNSTSPTVNFPIKTPGDRLTFFMHGCRPAFYFFSKFRIGAANWMGETDLITTTDEDLRFAVSKVREALDAYKPLADKQLLHIARYDYLANGLQCASYSDGSRIVGNFSDTAAEFEGHTIAPYDFLCL